MLKKHLQAKLLIPTEIFFHFEHIAYNAFIRRLQNDFSDASINSLSMNFP